MENKKILNEILNKELGLFLLYGENGSFMPVEDFSIIKDEKRNEPVRISKNIYDLEDNTIFYDDSFAFECNNKEKSNSAIMLQAEDLLEIFKSPLDEKIITDLKNRAINNLRIKDSFNVSEKTYSISEYDLYVLINLKYISDNYSVIPYVKNSNSKNNKKINFNYIDKDEALKTNFVVKTL